MQDIMRLHTFVIGFEDIFRPCLWFCGDTFAIWFKLIIMVIHLTLVPLFDHKILLCVSETESFTSIRIMPNFEIDTIIGGMYRKQRGLIYGFTLVIEKAFSFNRTEHYRAEYQQKNTQHERTTS